MNEDMNRRTFSDIIFIFVFKITIPSAFAGLLDPYTSSENNILRTRFLHAKHSQSGLRSPMEAQGLSLILALQRQMLFLVACCWFVGLVFNSTKV